LYRILDCDINQKALAWGKDEQNEEGNVKKSRALLYAFLSAILFGFGCSGPESDHPLLTTEVPLHLEDHLEAAAVTGSDVPDEVAQPVIWSFDVDQSDWKVLSPGDFPFKPAKLSRTDDALRVTLGKYKNKEGEEERKFAFGAFYVDVPDWTRDDWACVEVRARTSDKVNMIGLAFNLREESDTDEEDGPPFLYRGETARVIKDGTVQTYSLRADWSGGQWEGKWRQLILYSFAEEPGSIDILSVTVVPKEANYAGEPTGVRAEVRNRVYRRALFIHAPGRLEYQVRVPESGRLDLGLGVLRDDYPVTFRVSASAGGGETETLLEESYTDKESWGQRSVDLSHLAGQTVTLAMENDCAREGTVALWGAPTLTGAQRGDGPNVIFYVIDGAAADTMSIYGYNRRTTPNLDRLAAEGAVFEWAYSNSTWTKPSTASFMTSLQNSVLGGQTGFADLVPAQVQTMAEHMHRAGYQTSVFVANPNAGTLSGLQRSVDLMRESWEEFAYFGRENHKESSTTLHQGFWNWRETYPGEPYWVHFQTTDVHAPQDMPVPAPFSGLFVSPEELKRWKEWGEKLQEEGGRWSYSEAWEKTGIDRVAYYTVWQSLYDQAMAHNDYQLGRLVNRLKAEGEWDNTLLIVAADHSTMSAGADIGLAIQESLPPRWSRPIFRPSISRIPLVFVWPGHIEGGQRIDDQVSMIDVLPTILDLLDLPLPEIMMGQSLAPLMLGKEGWEPRPVIFDEFWLDRDSAILRGTLEVVDGRWGASLEINPEPPDEDEKEDEEAAKWRRPVPLLLYDLWNDYHCLNSIHEERPELVEKYKAFLEERWNAHLALSQHFTRSKESPMTPEQLESLRSLGYIR
jgi:arylsulfatase A-like enzyme